MSVVRVKVSSMVFVGRQLIDGPKLDKFIVKCQLQGIVIKNPVRSGSMVNGYKCY